MTPKTLCARVAVALLTGLVLGCNTEECRQLARELAERKEVLATAKRRAHEFEGVEQRAVAAERAARALLSELGLDKTDDEIHETLEVRVKEISGATLERGEMTVAEKGAAPEAPAERRTVWSVHFEERAIDAAFAKILKLLEPSPLVRFALLARDPAKAVWRVDLVKAQVPEVSLDAIPKVPLPEGRDPWSIPAELGFCGAGRLRDQLAAINTEINELRPLAEGTTVELPKAASYDGLRRRAERVRDSETETRGHVEAIGKTVIYSRVNLKGVVIEGTTTVLELVGDERDRAKAEKQIEAEGLGDLIQPRVPFPGGIERIVIRNAIAERQGPPPGKRHEELAR